MSYTTKKKMESFSRLILRKLMIRFIGFFLRKFAEESFFFAKWVDWVLRAVQGGRDGMNLNGRGVNF